LRVGLNQGKRREIQIILALKLAPKMKHMEGMLPCLERALPNGLAQDWPRLN